MVNSGGAVMPGGYDATPIIMDERQVMALIQESSDAKIIAVHMDAVDHCLTTRAVLRNEAKKMNIGNDKLLLTSSLKKHAFYNLLINNILYLCHLILGDTKGILTMFVRKKKYPSGNIGVIGQRRFFVS